mmetsp:Transcript_10286/g.25180  ORF Transcript_10286/g.25180 Transcript_10286/m.25180 type:complete len:91 (+) Transcript_10286:1010-1282(+)
MLLLCIFCRINYMPYLRISFLFGSCFFYAYHNMEKQKGYRSTNDRGGIDTKMAATSMVATGRRTSSPPLLCHPPPIIVVPHHASFLGSLN